MEPKSLTTILAEELGLDPAQSTDTRYQKLNTLLKIKSDNDLLRFVNKNIPTAKTKDKEKLLLHFKKYLRTHFTEEILKYYEQPFTNRSIQVNHCKNRISAHKETIQKQQHNNNSYEYFQVIFDELSLIESIISRIRTSNTSTRTTVPATERSQAPIGQTVFGLNFDFIGQLYQNLWAKGFIDDTCAKELFLHHFYIDTVPETRIRLIGKNQSDIGLLIDSLREFFKEDYQDSMFFNTFWAERFEFLTNGDPQNPKTKTPNGISRIISEVKTGNRKPTKINAINEIVENLQSFPQ